jgi:hypothetical protein
MLNPALQRIFNFVGFKAKKKSIGSNRVVVELKGPTAQQIGRRQKEQ